MDGNLSYVQRHLKNRQKSYLFPSHFEQHFKYTKSRTDLRKCIKFKVVNHLNQIEAMKSLMEPNCNIFIEGKLTTLKKLRDKCVTLTNNNSEIYGAFRYKMTFNLFFISNYDPVNG